MNVDPTWDEASAPASFGGVVGARIQHHADRDYL